MSTAIKSCNRCGGAILTGVSGWGGAICMCPVSDKSGPHWSVERELLYKRINEISTDWQVKELETQQLRNKVAELERALRAIKVVGQIDGHDVIRRSSVIDITSDRIKGVS